MLRRTLPAAFLLAGIGLLGCSNSRPDAEMTELTGRVTVKGRPAGKMIMKLTPETPGQGREDDCVVENGQYRVKVIAARYKVSFVAVPGGGSVPARYRTPETSQLTLDGTKSQPADFDLDERP